jgi:hypothetical protein
MVFLYGYFEMCQAATRLIPSRTNRMTRKMITNKISSDVAIIFTPYMTAIVALSGRLV